MWGWDGGKHGTGLYGPAEIHGEVMLGVVDGAYFGGQFNTCAAAPHWIVGPLVFKGNDPLTPS